MWMSLVCLAVFKTPDSTPEATVESVVNAFSKHDWKGVFSHIKGANVEQAVRFMKEKSVSDRMPSIILDKVDLVTRGFTSQGLVLLRRKSLSLTAPAPPPDDVQLVLVDGDWKIVGGTSQQSLFSQLAWVARSSLSALHSSEDAVKRTELLVSLRRISVAALMYTEHHDGTLDLSQRDLKLRLGPYLRDPKAFVAPDGSPLDVRFNSNLSGKKINDLENKSRLILFTIGPKGALVYIHGKTPVALVDGHVGYKSKKEVASLAWK